MKKHFLIRVLGTVQGVYFRTETKDEASRLNLSGWVRNEADGSVLIAIEGEEGALQNFLSWCRKGPESAKVEKIETQEKELEDLEGFEIRHT